jgi:NAD(P)H-hydrate epimerase
LAQQVIGSPPRLGAADVLIDEAYARSVLPRRDFGTHKRAVGGLVLVVGAPGYVGAAALCAQSAGRAGTGIMTLAVPRGVAAVVSMAVPEATFAILPDGDSPGAIKRAVERINEALVKANAMVVGPGLGDDEATQALLGALFGRTGAPSSIGFNVARAGGDGATPEPTEASPVAAAAKPVVVDADGLNWLATQENWWERLRPHQAVMTPHVGEMARLLDREPDDLLRDPLATVREAATAWQQIVVFKYGYTAVSDGERTLVAPDAPLSLATAGSGDVLAGAIGAFLAQGLKPLDAGALAIYAGCRAARRVERRVGTLGLIAGDLPLAIAEELAVLEGQRDA